MRVVAVMNYKGGVGKTTLTANLGALAADRGRSARCCTQYRDLA